MASRRTERKRIQSVGGATSPKEFNPDYGYVRSDLRRIGGLAAGLLTLLAVLAVLLN